MYIYICICIGGVDSCHLFVIDVFPFIIRDDDDDDVKGVQNVSLSLSSVLTKAPMMLMITTTNTTTTTTAAVVVP